MKLSILFLALTAATPAQGKAYRFNNVVDFGNVDEDGMRDAVTDFRRLVVEENAKNITLRIDSFGGSLFLGMKVGRLLEDWKKQAGVKVTCVVDGSAYSMAAVILESPLCDVRLATPRATILFHNGLAAVQGNADAMRGAADMLDALNTALSLQCAMRIGIPLRIFADKIAHGNWIMAAPEALFAGVIDGVVLPDWIAPPSQPAPTQASAD